MNTNHTPGPWHWGQNAYQKDHGQYTIGLGAPDDLCPEAGISGCRPGDYTNEYMSVGGICTEADARLIAAAPDLLAALKKIAHATKNIGESKFRHPEEYRALCEAWQEARVIIAAATGSAE